VAIERLPFGSTGHDSSRCIFGAAAFWSVDQAEADRTLALLHEHGINHLDVAHSNGDAEDRIGPWMADHRDDFFLATKTEQRTRDGARDEIRRSLERLRVDSVDLIQLHNLVDREEWETALGPGGALEAAIEAREEGLVRWIGVTGHGLAVAERHLASLERFAFDSVLLPMNYTMLQNRTYAETFDELLDVCEERGVAVQTIKSLAKGRWQGDGSHGVPWYEPIADAGAIRLAVAWTFGRPGIFLNTISDLSLLPLVLDAAESPGTPASDEQMNHLVVDQGLTPLFDAANPV
jgi:aryl-alcohol dehydrogenase-like predicted oxidoreductase